MASAYGGLGPKRPKIRESRPTDSAEYFQDKVEYNMEAAATDSTSYRYYNSQERVHGRSMEEWLRLAVSLTAFRSDGCDWTGKPTFNRSWDDRSNSIENYKRCLKACFEFCVKLGLKYWTAFDSDLVPQSDTMNEYRTNCDEIAEFVLENIQRTHVKPLWIAPDLHSHSRYASGASTSYDANIFIQAAAQVKKSLELAHRLNSECFLIWPLREGYDALFKSDVAREMKLFAKLLKMTAEYKDRLGFRGHLLIMPYYENQRTFKKLNDWNRNSVLSDSKDVNRYMWDATSCLYFLRHFNLDRSYKVCLPPGHQMYLTSVYNMLGGVDINNSMNEFDDRTLTLMMKSIIDQGGALPGGTTLSVTPRRGSVDARDLLTAYVGRVDSLARALRAASLVTNEQIFSKYVQQRYASYYSGYGSRLVGSDVTLEECEEHNKKSQVQASSESGSSRSEHWESVFRRYCDTAQRC